jgi:hypothetical protein
MDPIAPSTLLADKRTDRTCWDCTVDQDSSPNLHSEIQEPQRQAQRRKGTGTFRASASLLFQQALHPLVVKRVISYGVGVAGGGVRAFAREPDARRHASHSQRELT